MTARTLALLPLAALLLAGCAGLSWTGEPAPAHAGGPDAPDRADPGDDPVRAALHDQHREWAGTRYRHGGLSRSGVDCSGFVLLTFRSRFGIDLPRTTAAQARAGTAVDANRLRAGDLVFFRTGRTRLHVGIYVDDGRFLHASTSGGVMYSGLSESYWRARFWQARRLPGVQPHGVAERG